MVYYCFNIPFPVECGSPYLNLPPMPLDENSRPKKRARYTPDQLPAAISVASGKSVGTLTTPSDRPQDIFLISDAPSTDHTTMRDKPGCAKDKRGCCSRRHEGIRHYRKSRFYCSSYFIHKRVYYCHGPAVFKSGLRTCFI